MKLFLGRVFLSPTHDCHLWRSKHIDLSVKCLYSAIDSFAEKMPSSSSSSASAPGIGDLLKPFERTGCSGSVAAVSNNYLSYYDQSGGGKDEDRRKTDATAVANAYYNLATDFFEYGWGESFHFCVRRNGESREHSMSKHEYYLALKMGLQPGQRVLVSLIFCQF